MPAKKGDPDPLAVIQLYQNIHVALTARLASRVGAEQVGFQDGLVLKVGRDGVEFLLGEVHDKMISLSQSIEI